MRTFTSNKRPNILPNLSAVLDEALKKQNDANNENNSEEQMATFTDELRKESRKTETSKHELSQEEKEQQKRAEAVRSGALSSAIYEALKQELMRYVKERNILKLPQDNKYFYHCIYRPNEYRKKEKTHKSKYNKQYEECADFKRSSMQRSYLNYFLPHRVFSKEECDILQAQLAKSFEKDGFRYSFKVEEFKYKIYNGWFGLAKETQSYGYTLDFTVEW